MADADMESAAEYANGYANTLLQQITPHFMRSISERFGHKVECCSWPEDPVGVQIKDRSPSELELILDVTVPSATAEENLRFDSSDAVSSSLNRLASVRSGLRHKILMFPDLRLNTEYAIDGQTITINVCASGFSHGAAVARLTHAYVCAIEANGVDEFVTTSSDGKVTVGRKILAPDVVFYSHFPDGVPGEHGGKILTGVGEVELYHRSLLELIRHSGSVMRARPRVLPGQFRVNPTINCFLGTKLVRPRTAHHGDQCVLFVIERPYSAPDGTPAMWGELETPNTPLVILHAFDFGTDAMDAQDLADANAEMFVQFGVQPPAWDRRPQGRTAVGAPAIATIPFALLWQGIQGTPQTPLPALPAPANDVEINLVSLWRKLIEQA